MVTMYRYEVKFITKMRKEIVCVLDSKISPDKLLKNDKDIYSIIYPYSIKEIISLKCIGGLPQKNVGKSTIIKSINY